MKRSVGISGWLLAAFLAAAPLAWGQASLPAAAVAKAKAARTATEKASAKSNDVLPDKNQAPAAPAAAKPSALGTQGAAKTAKPSALATQPAAQAAKPGAAPPAAPPAVKKAAQQPKAGALPQVTRANERRDPFKTMLREKQAGDQPLQLECGPGIRGITVGQAGLNGIVRSPAGFLGVVTVPSGRTYFLHEGNAVCNGTVRSITPDSIIFVEDVIDAMGQPAKREVIKKIPADAK